MPRFPRSSDLSQIKQDQPTLTDRICFWIMIGFGLVSSYPTVVRP